MGNRIKVGCNRLVLFWLLWSQSLPVDAVSPLLPKVLGLPSPLPLPFSTQYDRRKILTHTVSTFLGTTGAIATAETALAASNAATPSKKADQEGCLISLESAAAQLSNGEDPFAHRLIYPHPGLRNMASPVTSFGTDDLETVVEALVTNMETNASTMVQYGIDARIIVLKGVPSTNPGNYYRSEGSSSGNSNKSNNNGNTIVFCNPTILSRSSEDKMVPWREYCLVVGTDIVWPEGEAPRPSTPGSTLTRGSSNDNNNINTSNTQSLLEVDLLRDATVEVAAQDITGKPIRMALDGDASRAFQHELDHLNGILIVDHAVLEDLPPSIAFLEEPLHGARQKQAFARTTYAGNGPLYY